MRCNLKENRFLFDTNKTKNKAKEYKYIIKKEKQDKMQQHVLYFGYLFCFIDLFQVFSRHCKLGKEVIC